MVPGEDTLYYNTSIPLVFGDWTDASPSAGLASFDYDVSGQGWQVSAFPVGTTTITIDPAVLTDGAQEIVFHATDAAGNAETDRSVTRYTDTTAPTTTDDYDGLWHNEALQLALSAVDEGAGVAGTYYSTDGETWVAGDSIAIDSPANFSGSQTMQYFSVDATQPDGNAEEPVSVDVLVDTVAPTSTITPSADLASPQASDVTLTLSATDVRPGSGVASIEYRVDGGDWAEGAEVTVPAAADHGNDGVHTVDVRATDAAGNIEDPQSVQVVIDTTAPETVIDGADSDWHGSDVTLTFDATDPEPGAGLGHIEYRIDGGAWVEGTEATIPAAGGDGVVAVDVRAVDLLGNAEEPQSVEVKIDTTAPVSEVTGGDADWHSSDVTLALTATDAEPGAGVAASYYRLDAADDWTAVEGGEIVVPAPADHSGDGVVTVEYYSEDAAVAANAEEPQSVEVKIDTTAPVSEVTGGDADWHSSDVTLALTATDAEPGAGVAASYYRLDAADDWTAVEGGEIVVPAPADHSGDGVVTVEYYSEDAAVAANAEEPQSVEVKIDTTAPVSDGATGWMNVSGLYTITAADDASGVASTSYRIDGAGDWLVYTTPFVVATVQGEHTIEFFSEDAAGNVEDPAVSRAVSLDGAAPVTTVAGADDLWHTCPVTLTFTATDVGGSTVDFTQYSLNAGSNWVKGSSVTMSTSSIATIMYRSVDMAGNVEVAKSVTVKVDTIGPKTYAKSLSGRKGRVIRLRYEATDNLSTKVNQVRVVVKNSSGKVVKSLKLGVRSVNTWYSTKWTPRARGTYRYRVYAYDEAGLKQIKIGVARVVVR